MAKAQDEPRVAAPYRTRAEAPVNKTAKAHKRRLLRRLGLRVTDLDAITAERLTDWALARALVDWATNNRTKATAFNAEQRALDVLEQRLEARSQVDPIAELARQGAETRARREQSGSSAKTVEGGSPALHLLTNDRKGHE